MASPKIISQRTKSRQKTTAASFWRPFEQPLFRDLWIASLASNIGTWMHEAGAAWLMTSLTSSPTLIALMQTATTLPIFFVALPAGALADAVDRRRILLATQTLMFVAAAMLSGVTFLGAMTPWLLLGLTFALGAGAAVNSPAWQAATAELVPEKDLPAAVTVTGMGLNLARAVGPALGGLIIALSSPWVVFLLNAVSFLGMIVVLRTWRHDARENGVKPKTVPSSVRAGIRYARHAPALRNVLVRTALFVPFASALWALLPLVARHELRLDSVRYGLFFGLLGGGAVLGAAFLPAMRRRLSMDSQAAGASVLFAIMTAGLTGVRTFAGLCFMLMVAGAAWIALMTSFNVAVQMAAPLRARARAVAAYLLVFHGSMAAGSALWGAVAERAGISTALLWASAGIVAGLAALGRYPLRANEKIKSALSIRLPESIVAVKPKRNHDAVLIVDRYPDSHGQALEFTGAAHEMRHQPYARLRKRSPSALHRDGTDTWKPSGSPLNP